MMVEKAAGTELEAVCATVAATWEDVKAEIRMRAAGVELLRYQAALVQDGLIALTECTPERVADQVVPSTLTSSS